MRSRGWCGDPPGSDDDARRRILDATRRCIDEQGAGVGISDVARSLGVTRPTIYRYYASNEELLIATVIDTTAGFLDRVYHRFPGCDGCPQRVVVEAVVRVLEQLPKERYLWLLLTTGRASLFSRGVTSPLSMGFGHAIVERMPVDWPSWGVGPRQLAELDEHVVRTIQSFMLDRGSPPRTGRRLRAYLDRWLAPPVGALCDGAADPRAEKPS